MTAIETRIRDAVVNSGLNQSELARRTGATRTATRRWQKTGQISVNYLPKLCQALDVDINDLIFGNDDFKPTDTHPLKPLQTKVIAATRNIPDEQYYKLEEVLKLLTE